MARKRINVFLILAAATLGIAGIMIWKVFRARSSAEQPYVGKWRFISGQVKAGAGFPLTEKVASDGTTTKPLAGNLAVVEERDGVLWYLGDDRSCSYELRVGGGKAEVFPGGKVKCETTAPDGGGAKRPTSVRMSMVIDAQNQAHIAGQAQATIDFKGQRRDLAFTYDGIAVRDMPPAR
ncbi:MAG TPA: hypothetical protein VH374_12580 [Polyangia bacterium]|nr:hypothetical protein [Polyangia bacterium]